MKEYHRDVIKKEEYKQMNICLYFKDATFSRNFHQTCLKDSGVLTCLLIRWTAELLNLIN